MCTPAWTGLIVAILIVFYYGLHNICCQNGHTYCDAKNTDDSELNTVRQSCNSLARQSLAPGFPHVLVLFTQIRHRQFNFVMR